MSVSDGYVWNTVFGFRVEENISRYLDDVRHGFAIEQFGCLYVCGDSFKELQKADNKLETLKVVLKILETDDYVRLILWE